MKVAHRAWATPREGVRDLSAFRRLGCRWTILSRIEIPFGDRPAASRDGGRRRAGQRLLWNLSGAR